MIHREENPALISVIIPVYNQAKQLLAALESIKNQTYKNLEVIVVDDGSVENVQNVVNVQIERLEQAQRYNKRSDITFYQQEHQGAPAARNKGLELSHGEYVIFWDADIVAEPEMLEKMYQTLREHPEASYAYCNFRFQISDFRFTKCMHSRQFDVKELKKNNYIHSTGLIRRKDAIKWDESLKRFQDWDLWLTMAEQGKKGVWIDEYLFAIISRGTMSSWLPSFAYKKPWQWLPGIRERVRRYEEARKVVVNKHPITVVK